MSTVLFNTNPEFVAFHHGGPPNLLETLAPGLYVLRMAPHGPYLERKDMWNCNEAIYGSSRFLRERFVLTALERSANPKKISTGMLLYGPAGVGKTMLGRYVSNDLVKKGFPIINIPSNIDNAVVAKVCEDIKQPCVIFIDEFEKRFEVAQDECPDPQQQNIFLSLLDGTFRTSHIYILTANVITGLNSYLFNRPGRIYYKIKFDYLDEKTILEYLQGNNIPQNVQELVIDISKKVRDLTFDQLSAIVEECTRYPDDKALMIAQRLNIDYFVVNFNEDFKVEKHNFIGHKLFWSGEYRNTDIEIEKDDVLALSIAGYGFANHLYLDLTLKNVYVFENEEEIKVVRNPSKEERDAFEEKEDHTVDNVYKRIIFGRDDVVEVDSFGKKTEFYNDGNSVTVKTAYSVSTAYDDESWGEYMKSYDRKKAKKLSQKQEDDD